MKHNAVNWMKKNSPLIVLGLHRDPWHNSGAAIIRDDGYCPYYVMLSEERFARIKDSRAFPELCLKACLSELKVSIDEIDAVVVDYIRTPDWRNDQFRVPSIKDTFLEQID